MSIHSLFNLLKGNISSAPRQLGIITAVSGEGEMSSVINKWYRGCGKDQSMYQTAGASEEHVVLPDGVRCRLAVEPQGSMFPSFGCFLHLEGKETDSERCVTFPALAATSLQMITRHV